MLGAFGEQEAEIFSGHAFQDMAANRKDKPKHFDLVSCFAPLLDCMMTQHKLDNEIHAQRRNELLEIEKRIQASK